MGDYDCLPAMRSSLSLRKAWAVLLNEVLWDHRADFTFRLPIGVDDAFKRLQAWADSFTAETQGPIAYFAVAERTHAGHWHLHVLVGGTGELRIRDMIKRWHSRNGYARVVSRVDTQTISYVTKQLNQNENWAMSNSLVRVLRQVVRKSEIT